jgi:hypothetical protein
MTVGRVDDGRFLGMANLSQMRRRGTLERLGLAALAAAAGSGKQDEEESRYQ